MTSMCTCVGLFLFFFFFNDTATTEIYTLSLHDALPICEVAGKSLAVVEQAELAGEGEDVEGAADLVERVFQAEARFERDQAGDRKSTRLNSSHANISYAVFCLKKKKTKRTSSRSYIGR